MSQIKTNWILFNGNNIRIDKISSFRHIDTVVSGLVHIEIIVDHMHYTKSYTDDKLCLADFEDIMNIIINNS